MVSCQEEFLSKKVVTTYLVEVAGCEVKLRFNTSVASYGDLRYKLFAIFFAEYLQDGSVLK